jgi:hypothetical protein
MGDQKAADELEKRIFIASYPNQAAAIAFMATLDTREKSVGDMNLRIRTMCAGDSGWRNQPGDEVFGRASAIVSLVNAIANGDEHVDAEAVASSFTGPAAGMTTDVTITADTAGAAGNSISLSFDGMTDVDDALAAWNLANPSNTASLISGDGSQTPDDLETIDLADGADKMFSDADFDPAYEALGDGTMSAKALESMTSAFGDAEAAREFLNAMSASLVVLID